MGWNSDCWQLLILELDERGELSDSTKLIIIFDPTHTHTQIDRQIERERENLCEGFFCIINSKKYLNNYSLTQSRPIFGQLQK